MGNKNEKVEEICTAVPTGYSILDKMLGENKRDLYGNITDAVRGFEVTGKQYAIAAQQGAGKSTLIADISSFPLHIGMQDCIHKIIIIDTDNASWDKHRIRKLTDLSFDVIDEKYKIYQVQDVEEISDILKKESEEYNKCKYKPVKFFDYYMGTERKMMPFTMVIVDTVTSLSASMYEKDMLAKQQSLTTFLDVSNLSNNVGALFSHNNCVIWMAHLKDNVPKIGQTIANKEFKAAPASLKSHIPLRIKQKLSTFIWLTKTLDMENQESKTHPIQVYGMKDMNSKSIFVTNAITVKSRTGTEGRTVAKLMFIDGRFDRIMSLLASCLSLGIFKEGGGQHPSVSGGKPSIFREQPDCEAEQKAQGNRSKSTLLLNGYDRPTNIIEARLLLNYTGDNEFLLTKQAEMGKAIEEEMEEVLAYELETNNVTEDELRTNQAKIRNLIGFIRTPSSKAKKLTKEELDAITPPVQEEYLK